jgi:hypothetical protein
MYYAAARDECSKAFALLPPNGRFETKVDALFAEERAPVDRRKMPAEQKLSAESFEVLKAWALERKAALSK